MPSLYPGRIAWQSSGPRRPPLLACLPLPEPRRMCPCAELALHSSKSAISVVQASPTSPEDPQARFLSGLHSIQSPRPSIKRPHWGTAIGSFPSKRGAPAASLRPTGTAPDASKASNSPQMGPIAKVLFGLREARAGGSPAELCQPEPPISPWSATPCSEPGTLQPGMAGSPHSSLRQPVPRGIQGPSSSPPPDERYMREVYAMARSPQEAPDQAQLLPRAPAPYSLPVGPGAGEPRRSEMCMAVRPHPHQALSCTSQVTECRRLFRWCGQSRTAC